MIRIIYAMNRGNNSEPLDKIIADRSHNKDVEFEIVGSVDVSELLKYDLENTIFIARGIGYRTLSKRLKNAHSVELAVSGYDIMRGIMECQRAFKAKKIAIVLSETTMVEKDLLEKTLGVDLTIFPARDYAHLNEVYETIKLGDFDAILSGYSIYNRATGDQLDSVRITNGYEANRIAINEAYSIAHAIIEERKKNELFKVILENTNDGIIAVDNLGSITAYNEAVFKILNIPSRTSWIGKSISAVIPALREVNIRMQNHKETNIIKTINNKMIVINSKQIKVEGKTLGIVLFIQNVDDLQKTEIDIRQKLSKKGLVAKYNFHNLIGTSEVFGKTVSVAKRYAATNSNILIIGETGTGKELFAQSIHNNSSRSNQPFVAINCAALPEQLLESELFGYVEGAFTGASKGGKVGLFELAHKGTLFLDEITEIPLGLQAKLLRVLQEKEIRKLGDDKIIPVDVRIIAAANVDLQQKVEENKFRQDLLYRLDILKLSIPPLRDRKCDIKEIAVYFLAEFTESQAIPIEITQEAVLELIKYNWPGNIRELKNICERLTVLCTNNRITEQDVQEIFNSKLPKNFDLEFKEQTKGVVQLEDSRKMTRQEMADILGISRTTLWRKTRQGQSKDNY